MTLSIAPHTAASHAFLGVDGGGSKTLAIVVDEQGQERGRGQAGSSNYAAVGVHQAIVHLRAAAEEAAQVAGYALPLKAAWLGLAGVDRPEDVVLLSPFLEPLAEQIHLTNDAELVLSGLEHSVGVALIAGTGSIALGRDADGNSTRAGGWGHILGDEGSGYEIGRLALQAAARAADGRDQPTLLLNLIMSQWGLRKAEDMIGQVYKDEDKAQIARLSSLVFIAAHADDEAARQIVQHAAQELALAALTVGKALNFPDDRMPLALGGGLLVHEAVFRMQVLRRIRHRLTPGPIVIVDQPALSGARAAIALSQTDERSTSAAIKEEEVSKHG